MFPTQRTPRHILRIREPKMNNRLCRRRFIASSAAASIAGVALPSLGSAQETIAVTASNKTAATIFKSLKWGMIQGGETILDKLRLVGELGFDGVELNSPSNINLDEVREAVKETGVIVDGVVDSTHWKIRLSSADEKVRNQGLADLQTAIRDSHAAGGTSVLLVPGHGDDGDAASIQDLAAEQIEKALPLAAKLGVFILIENVWNKMFYQHDGPNDQTADALAEFIDRFDSPWMGVQFDIGNHQKYGQPADWIRRLGRRIVKLDVKDWGVDNGFCKIGDGDVDWPAVCVALADIGYRGWAAAEVAGGDRERLQDVSNRMDRVFGLN